MMKETRTQSWLPLKHCRSCRKTPTCSLLTVTPHTNTQTAYWICNTGRQGSRNTSVRYPSTWEQGGVDIQLPQWEHHGGSYKLSLSLHPYTHGKGLRLKLNRNATQHYSHSEITVGATALSDGLRIFILASKLWRWRLDGATSKVWMPEGWYKASSIPRAHNTGVPYEPQCHPLLFVPFTWNGTHCYMSI